MSSPQSNQDPSGAGSKHPPVEYQKFLESEVNLSLLDPAKWGWTAAGGVGDLLTPHERARRAPAKKAYIRGKRKRDASMSESRDVPLSVPTAQQHQQQKPAEAHLSNFDLGVAMMPEATKPKAAPAAKGGVGIVQAFSGSAPLALDASKPIRFAALTQPAGTLDMHTYHRGREGMELRDDMTGELLCDVEPTDTSFKNDGPNLVAQVCIRFPLEDTTTTTTDDDQDETRYYKETISWDLGDAETPTPMAYAANIAEEFGLSYQQAFELAESIQGQLQNFVRENCAVAPVFSRTDPYGLAREAPTARAVTLYGDVVGCFEGGRPLPSSKTPRAASITKVATLPVVEKEVSTGKAGKSKAPGKRRRESSSSVSFSKVIEEVFFEEAKKRLKRESTKRISDNHTTSDEAPGGEIKALENYLCHICKRKRSMCGLLPCGNINHALCNFHLEKEYGFSIPEQLSPIRVDCCSMCSLSCSCDSCSKRLRSLAKELKCRCAEQNLSAENVVFDDIFEYTNPRSLQSSEVNATSAKRSGVAGIYTKTSRTFEPVPKIPKDKFPKEPGTVVDEIEFRLVYSAEGVKVLEKDDVNDSDKRKSSEEKKESESDSAERRTSSAAAPVVEDGSIDHCMVCRKFGNLYCCDFCPRAFHPECIKESDQQDESDSPWECPSCIRDKVGTTDEQLSGTKSLRVINTAYRDLSDVEDEEFQRGLMVLSIIHEMLLFLMDFDFGYVFRQPVDPKAVPQYRKVVKKPMDLGTIAAKLKSGGYRDRFEKEKNLSSVISAVLQDIELVWHNCFTFNFPGSAIYRMAEVQKKCAKRIQQKSFDDLISDEVKLQVQAFSLSCERLRKHSLSSSGKDKTEAKSPSLPMSARRKIVPVTEARVTNTRAKKPIAVFDPETGRVVKLYSTVAAASKAVDFFLTLGHRCEWNIEQSSDRYQILRRIVKEGPKNPTWLLFGYRWLPLAALREGKVIFAEKNSETEDGEHVAPTGKDDEQQAGFQDAVDETGTTPGSTVTYIREDLNDGRSCLEFSSVEEAHQDWLKAMESSSSTAEDRTLVAFMDHYLDKDIAVRGLMWKTKRAAQNGRGRKVTKPASSTNPEPSTSSPGVNRAFQAPDKSAGRHRMLGVYGKPGRLYSQVKVFCRTTQLGFFDTAEQCQIAYFAAKEVRNRAERPRSDSELAALQKKVIEAAQVAVLRADINGRGSSATSTMAETPTG